MICIEGWYEDGEDEFYYEVYLRPWGQLWDDFCCRLSRRHPLLL